MNKISSSEYFVFSLVFLVGGGMSGLFGLTLDVVLADVGFSPIAILFFSNFLAGLVACWLYWSVRMRKVERQLVADGHTVKIGQMKHFVGKSLAVISAYVESITDPRSKQALAGEIKQIQWAVEYVLPCGWKNEQSGEREQKTKPVPQAQAAGMAAVEQGAA